jgi:predicted nuclease of restriction endonuclease-like (RecB) superfamily
MYWEIGEEITRQQNEKGWGKSIVDILSKELQKEFPGVQGFSARNLWLMRSFYIEYSGVANLQPSVAEISWTKDVLINNIENRAYERYLANQTNFDATVSEKYRLQAKHAVKDEYNYDFLERLLPSPEEIAKIIDKFDGGDTA